MANNHSFIKYPTDAFVEARLKPLKADGKRGAENTTTMLRASEAALDPKLFEIMTLVGKDNIIKVDKEVLIKLNAVNNGNISTTWEIKSSPEGTYLRGLGVDERGEHKIMFVCDHSKHKIGVIGVFQTSNPLKVIEKYSRSKGLQIDGQFVEVPMNIFAEQGYVFAVFSPDIRLASRIAETHEIGLFMQGANTDVFVGFSITQNIMSQDAMGNIISECQNSK